MSVQAISEAASTVEATPADDLSASEASVVSRQIDHYIAETDRLLEKIHADQQLVDRDAAETRAILKRIDRALLDFAAK